MIRIFLEVRDPERRARLIRLLRSDGDIRLVGAEDEADLLVRETRQRIASFPAISTEELTGREIEILRLVATGLDNRAIGEELGVSRSTVKHHLESIYAKLDVHGRTEAVRVGLKRGLVPL